MKVFKFSVDVDEKKATSFLKAKNSTPSRKGFPDQPKLNAKSYPLHHPTLSFEFLHLDRPRPPRSSGLYGAQNAHKLTHLAALVHCGFVLLYPSLPDVCESALRRPRNTPRGQSAQGFIRVHYR